MLQAREIQRDFVTPEEVATLYHCHPFTVRRRCKNGKIPAERVLNHWYISRTWFEAEQARLQKLNANSLNTLNAAHI